MALQYLPQTSNLDSSCSDRSFGPFNGCRFDFTLCFEQFVLSSVPSALLLLLAPARIIYLYRQDDKVVRYPLRIIKLVLGFCLIGLQLALVILWSLSRESRTPATVPFIVISLLAAIIVAVLSQLEHCRSIRPSSMLNLYLLFSLMLDLPQARTLYFQDGILRITTVFWTSIGVKIVLLFCEAREKDLFLKSAFQVSSPESTAGIINQSFIWWLNGIFNQGYQSLSLFQSKYELDEDLTASHLGNALQESWEQRSQPTSRFALVFAISRTLYRPFSKVFFPRLCLIGFTYTQPFLITHILDLLSKPDNESTRQEGYLLIAITVLIYLGIAISSLHASHNLDRFITMFRGASISLVYKQTLSVEDDIGNDSAAVSLMSTDVDRIAICFEQINECWSRLIEVAIGIPLLAQQIGWVSIMPLVVVGLSTVGSGTITKYISGYQKRWADATQRRLTITSSMLGQMKSIKMMGLSRELSYMLQDERIKETKKMESWAWVIVWMNVIANIPFVMAPAVTFVVYAIQAILENSNSLNTTQAFTSLALIMLVSNPASILLTAVPNIAASIGCFDRIQNFLLKKTRDDRRILFDARKWNNLINRSQHRVKDCSKSEDIPMQLELMADDHWMVRIEDATIFPAENTSFALRDVSMAIIDGSTTMIVGPVGTGKTTLLKAILGEVSCQKGNIFLKTKSMAYCSQTPWLPNGTIQQTIRGFTNDCNFDEEWYKTVIDVCSLKYDLLNLSAGDQTIIGAKGVTLSGGQKQRVALARALYCRPEVFVLDDILSALDRTTEEAVVNQLFGKHGIFQKLKSTVILVTNATRCLTLANNVAVLTNDGKFHQGSYKQMVDAGLITEVTQDEYKPQHFDDDPLSEDHKMKCSALAAEDEFQDLKRPTGDLAVYRYYFGSIGTSKMAVFVIFALLNVFSWSFSQIWLKWWTDIDGGQATLFAIVYLLLAVGYCIGIGGYAWAMVVVIGPSTGRGFHRVLLRTIMRAPQSFFATTDVGILLNRFSQDMALIEGRLAHGLLATCTNLLSSLAEAGLIALGSAYMAITIPLFMIAIYFLQRVYLRTSRQLRLLDLEARAPLYSHFIETLEGLLTIRAFGWQAEAAAMNSRRLDYSQKPYYLMYCIQRWLALILDLLVAAMAVSVVALATTLRHSTSPGLLGVSMNNILAFNGSISAFVTGWTVLETSLGAIARLRNLEASTKVEAKKGEDMQPPENWPSKGLIDIQNLTASYNPSQIALQKVSMTIYPGQKVGICGRTGSGKSSLLSTIVRILDYSSGSIEIDGIDLSTIPRDIIRRHITTMPQDPLRLPGTVRLNADPFSSSSDDAIIDALAKVGLWHIIVERGGLDAEMQPDSLSKGQQQLLALARAMLRKSMILLLDEATSSIDEETDTTLQKLIREEFRECTVVTVAHRLDTIVDSDVIAVMDAGRLIEFGNPEDLMKDLDSAVRKLWGSRL